MRFCSVWIICILFFLTLDSMRQAVSPWQDTTSAQGFPIPQVSAWCICFKEWQDTDSFFCQWNYYLVITVDRQGLHCSAQAPLIQWKFCFLNADVEKAIFTYYKAVVPWMQKQAKRLIVLPSIQRLQCSFSRKPC